jgi:hypothetical protein
MSTLFRLDSANAHARNPHRPRGTQRAPGNVPYLVDNLWEWRRPENMPNRRHSVYASPSAELAQAAGVAVGGCVYTVNPTQARIAQIPQKDARFHPEAAGSASLNRLILKLLGQPWIDGVAAEKSHESLLWAPCLRQHEVEAVFKNSPYLAPIRDTVWNAISFWGDAILIKQGQTFPFEEGELFFEAVSWDLVNTNNKFI